MVVPPAETRQTAINRIIRTLFRNTGLKEPSRKLSGVFFSEESSRSTKANRKARSRLNDETANMTSVSEASKKYPTIIPVNAQPAAPAIRRVPYENPGSRCDKASERLSSNG